MSIALIRAAGAAAQAGRRRTLAGGVPVNTVPPSISGTVAHGNVLTVTPGTWTGSPSLSYQWYAGASAITGETGTTYTCDRADGICGADYVRCVESDSVGATTADSNDLLYVGADLPLAGFSLDEDVTVVSGGVDSIASSYGSISVTATAPSSTQRPAFGAGAGVGGRDRMISDGVDDVLYGTMTYGSSRTSTEIGFVGGRVAFGALVDVAVGYGAPSSINHYLADNNAASLIFVAPAPSAPASTTDPDTTVGHWSGGHPGGTASNVVRLGGTTEATGSSGAFTTRADAGRVMIGGNAWSGAAYGNYDYRAAYACGAYLTADQRTDLRDLLTRRTGVTS